MIKRKYSEDEITQLMTGRIYFNRNDSAIYVRRKGLGSWTMNLGNGWTWIILAGELVAIFVVLFYFL